jgi:hypothetical protein
MARYALRTCERCGIRKPQPEMLRKEIYSETGKSLPGVSGFTWFGLLLGDRKSVHSINRWIFNTSQRNYKRKKQVWICDDCAGYRRTSTMTFRKFFYYNVVALTAAAVYYVLTLK